MRKYYFTIASILFLVVGLASCSNEENKTQNDTASRPTVPVMAHEVRIGNQIWMTKNLNVSRYRNGDIIPQVTGTGQLASVHSGAWCYYNNDPANGLIYGKLYNWFAVSDPRGLAPQGWHVASNAEWETLDAYLGIETAGGKMKEAGLAHWQSPNTGANNSSGFSALPGGKYNDPAGFGAYSFKYLGTGGYWWTSSESPFLHPNAIYRYLNNMSGHRAYASDDSYLSYHSVRCVKN